MKRLPILSALIEHFFSDRLMRQRNVSPHTIASYRDTFRLLLQFIHRQLKIQPSNLQLRHIDAPLICAFLDDLETTRAISASIRNLRLTAIRSFFKFVALEEPAYSGHIQICRNDSSIFARPHGTEGSGLIKNRADGPLSLRKIPTKRSAVRLSQCSLVVQTMPNEEISRTYFDLHFQCIRSRPWL